MFTGLVEEVGIVAAAEAHAGAAQLKIESADIAGKINLGDSIAVNGCCLTVSARADDVLTFDLLSETLERTNLKTAGPGSRVNLERAVAAGAPLGGHFVQGHIDCASPIVSLGHNAHDLRIEIELPHEFAHYVAFKGSIAVNGISLTVAEISERSFVVWIIPHTKARANLGDARVGDLVNLEFDLLAKYVERLIHRRSPP